MSSDGDDLHGLATEQARPELSDLDLLSVEQLVSLMCADVRRVPEAVEAAEEQIAIAVGAVAASARARRAADLRRCRHGRPHRPARRRRGRADLQRPAGPGRRRARRRPGRPRRLPSRDAEDERDGGEAAMTELGVGQDDAVVGIAASGRTPFVLGAVEAARRAGALTVGVVCNERTPLAELAELAIEVLVGPEIVAGSTRLNAGTAQKVVLNIISTAAMVQLGKTYGGLMVDLRATNTKLRDRATRIVAEIAGVSREQARAALEQCDWSPKSAAAMLVGETGPVRREPRARAPPGAGSAPPSRSSGLPGRPAPARRRSELGVAAAVRRRDPRAGRRRDLGRPYRCGRAGGPGHGPRDPCARRRPGERLRRRRRPLRRRRRARRRSARRCCATASLPISRR